MKKMNPIAMAVVLIVSMVSFYQCTHDEELFAGFPVVHDFQNLQQLHDTLTLNDTVGLSISDPTIENIVQGAQGTKLIVPANSLTLPGGGEATPPFSVSMLEIFKRGDMIRHNVQTFAGQSPLVSGGVLWLQIKDANGATLALNGVQAVLPYRTNASGYENDMQHYTGTNQSAPSGSQIVSWGAGSSEVTYNAGAGVSGEFTIATVSNGWNHAASPLQIPDGQATQFSVRVPNSSDFSQTEVFFTMNEFTTVAALTSVQGDAISTFTGTVPTGAQGKLVAISLVEGALHFGVLDVTVSGDDEFSVSVQPGTVPEFQSLLSAMN